MGNAESSIYQKRLSRLTPSEQAEIQQSFEKLCGAKNAKKCQGLAAFQDVIGSSVPRVMSGRIFCGIQAENVTGKATPPGPEISKEQYLLFLADIVRGTAEEKRSIVSCMIASEGKEEVTGQQVLQFLEDLIGAVVYVLRREKALRGWSLDKTRDCESGTRTLAMQLMSQLKASGGQALIETECLSSTYPQSSIEDWLYKCPLISLFLRIVVTLGLSVMRQSIDHQDDLINLVPKCKAGKVTTFCSLLDFPSVVFLNSHLPSDMQNHWRLVFSTQVHGESFSQLCGLLVDQGPTLLVLRDSDGFIFGGFASHNWEVRPQFQGDHRCFLFTVSPQLEIYTYTGYNDHYMYLNRGQKTMPSGLGMGGQLEYFGVWISSDFGKGHSKAKPKCTTYNSPQLSAREEFSLDSMEVWALGDLPEELVAKNKKSVLDADPEARALLEMTGRTRQSDGLRNEEEDEES